MGKSSRDLVLGWAKVQLEDFGQSLNAARSIDACDLTRGGDQGVLAIAIEMFANQMVVVLDTSSMAITDPRAEGQQVIEEGG